jgi:polyribonucleotide nucleotidyltransferase
MIDEILNPRIPEIGEVFHGKVVKIAEFGAFVSILPGTDGLVHISELKRGGERIDRVEDVLNVGDEIDVVVLSVEQGMKMKIGLRPIFEGETAPTKDEIEAMASEKRERRGSRDRDGGGRGGRDRDRGRSREGAGRDRPRRRED